MYESEEAVEADGEEEEEEEEEDGEDEKEYYFVKKEEIRELSHEIECLTRRHRKQNKDSEERFRDISARIKVLECDMKPACLK